MTKGLSEPARVTVRGVPSRSITLAQIGKKGNLYMSKVPPVLGVSHPAFAVQAPAFAAQLARIEVDPDTVLRLLSDIPAGTVVVAESGISDPAEVQAVGPANARALVAEAERREHRRHRRRWRPDTSRR